MRAPLGSYWVVPRRLLAGEYPHARLDVLLGAGITSFVDLTRDDEELEPYAELLGTGARYVRRPIRDFDCPAEDELRETLDLVDAELERGEVVYLHCHGGRGRTGTVVGCWLVRHGVSGEAALARIAELRVDVPAAERHRSPETRAQRKLVRTWRESRAATADAAAAAARPIGLGPQAAAYGGCRRSNIGK